VRQLVDSLVHLLDVDRRAALGLERYDVDWPVCLQVPLDPVAYDALRFLSSLYPARPADILRASVLPILDPGADPPEPRSGTPALERTARVELGLSLDENRRLAEHAATVDATPEDVARWALEDAMGPLMEVHRPR
jgi:hypothetical protein